MTKASAKIRIKRTTGSGPGMLVVLYLRKSNKTKTKSRDETVSIQQQRDDLHRWCKERGWKIVAEYVDDGKSASKNDVKRVRFVRMLVDAKNADFRAVVVWDLSRLTRKDSVDASQAAGVFKENGILVESMRDGEIDLTTSMGRTVWTLHCEGNHEFSKKVSCGTIRGRKDSMNRGNFATGQIPYGYRRQYWDGETLVKEMHRHEPGGKARHWSTKIVTDPVEGPIAARIFHDFATRDVSRRGLAIELETEGAPRCHGQQWTAAHVKTILRCPIYRGDAAIGYCDQWEREAYEAHGRSEKMIKENVWPALTDRETWQRANDKLQEIRESGKRVQAGKSSPLSGIVFCGHCGKAMAKNTRKGVTRFTCSTAAKNSANSTCKQWNAHESDILPVMVAKLVEAVDFEILKRMQAAAPEEQTGQLAELEQRETELSKKVAKAARNLALCEPSNCDDVQAVLTDLKTELEKVKNTAHLLRTASDKTELQRIAKWWEENWERLVVLRPGAPLDIPRQPDGTCKVLVSDLLKVTPITSEPDVFRDLLKRLNARLTLHFVQRKMGAKSHRQYYAIEWGRLTAEISDMSAVHSMNDCGPADEPAPTAKPCASRYSGPARSRANVSAMAPPMPAWTAGNCAPTAS